MTYTIIGLTPFPVFPLDLALIWVKVRVKGQCQTSSSASRGLELVETIYAKVHGSFIGIRDINRRGLLPTKRRQTSGD